MKALIRWPKANSNEPKSKIKMTSKLIIMLIMTLGIIGTTFAYDGFFGFDTSGYFNKVADIRNPSGTVLNLTGSLKFGSDLICTDSRIFDSNQEIHITVCDSACNYTTINEAWQSTSIYIGDRYIIEVDGNDYTANENVLLEKSHGYNYRDDGEGGTGHVRIIGHNYPRVNSIYISGVTGVENPQIIGFNITGNSTIADEGASIIAFASNTVGLYNIIFSGSGDNAFVAYSSTAKLTGINITGNYAHAVAAKKNSMVDIANDPLYGNIYGNVSGFPFYTLANGIIYITNESLTYPAGNICRGTGFCIIANYSGGSSLPANILDNVHGTLENWNIGGNSDITGDLDVSGTTQLGTSTVAKTVNLGNTYIAGTQDITGQMRKDNGVYTAWVIADPRSTYVSNTNTAYKFVTISGSDFVNNGAVVEQTRSDTNSTEFRWGVGTNPNANYMSLNHERLLISGAYIQGEDYYSGDGTQGMTGTCGSATTLTVKDGLITACS